MRTRVVDRPIKSQAVRSKVAPTLNTLRSAISNGTAIIADADHRSAPMRRLRDLIAAMTSDLGGAANISEAERLLIRRAGVLALQLEMQEQRWAANKHEASPAQLDLYIRTAGNLRRVFETLGVGLPRRAYDITPSTDHVVDASPSLARELLDRFRHNPDWFKAAVRGLDPATRAIVRREARALLYPAPPPMPTITLQDSLAPDEQERLYKEVQELDDTYGLFDADDDSTVGVNHEHNDAAHPTGTACGAEFCGGEPPSQPKPITPTKRRL